jgi:23S rRNA (cytidine1920-2'-O)/16S rRNA (cytidine1409-2'-O)-methyltransferase
VRSLERTDIRCEDLKALRGGLSLVVADLAVIGLRSVADALVGFAQGDADLVILIKPQFEAGRAEVSRGKGVIRDPQVWRGTLESAIGCMEQAGAAMIDVMVSPLRGAGGNAEFLSHFKVTSPGAPMPTTPARPSRETAIASAVAAAQDAARQAADASSDVCRQAVADEGMRT